MSDIFLSYKSEDRARAKIFTEALEQQGYSVWWDRVIPPGKTFDKVIEEKLKEAKCVVVLWSQQSVFSDWVKIEASIGAKRRILVPVLIDNVEIPLEFSRIQAAQLVDWDGRLPNPEFDLLLNSVVEIVGRPKAAKMVDELNNAAQQLYEEEKYSEAIEKWKGVLNLDPENKIAKDGIKKTQEKIYETRGTIWNEVPIAGSVGGSGKTAAWDAYNFAGFYYDLQENLGRESLQVLQTNLAANQRTIDNDMLVYSTAAEAKRLKVVEKFNDDVSAASAGLKRTGAGQAFAGGNYYIVGWNSDRYVAINGRIDKLSRLVTEQGEASSEKKTLTVGETWDVGGGWTVTVNSIDAKASPRQVWFTLSKDGVKKDDKIVAQGNIYTYVEKSIGGESDVPLFVTYIDSVFAGAISDMAQLRYTWAIDTSVTEVKGGDFYGVFKVVTLDTTDKSLVLRNTDLKISLSQGSTVVLMGNLIFKVADRADVLRFMPIAVYEFRGSYN